MSSAPNPATITYEQLMALFIEDREKSEREWEKSRREWQEIREQQKETDRIVKETSQQIAKLGDRLGELVQAMVEGGIKRMFKNLGYDFDVVNPEYEFGNKTIGFGEVDILLENGDFALLVEVKTKLTEKDILEHRERLEKFRLVSDSNACKGFTLNFFTSPGNDGKIDRSTLW